MNRALCAQGVCVAVFGLATGVASAISSYQIDNFESGDRANWANGPSSPNQPFTVEEDGNVFVRNNSTGTSGPGSRMVLFNRAQWSGNYNAAGVTALTMDLRNSGETDLYIRLGLLGQTGTRTATNDVIELAAGSDWTTMTFNILDLTVIVGEEPISSVLSGVLELRILSAEEVDYQADNIAGTLDVDNIRTGIPAPGAVGLFALAGTACIRRRR